MGVLQDSGSRREFPTGAVRDVADGKGRADLLPLREIEELLYAKEEQILFAIDAFIRTHDERRLMQAIHRFSWYRYGDTITGILETSKQFEDGAEKYGDRNWEKGIPLHCYLDSAVRHYLKFKRGDQDEPHDRAVLWNLMCALWTFRNCPEMNDLPEIRKERVEVIEHDLWGYEK